MKISVKEKAIGIIEELPDDEVARLLSYLLWLQNREEWEATMELLSDPEAMESISRGIAEVELKKTVPWSVVKEEHTDV